MSQAASLRLRYRRLPAGSRLGLCLFLSALAHGLLLGHPGWITPHPAAGAGAAVIHAPLTATLLAVPPAPLPPPATAGRPVQDETADSPSIVPTPAPPSPGGPAVAQAPGLLLGPWYYTAKWLHRRPTPLHPILPQYPPAAGQIAGRVRLLLLINEQGGLDSYRVQEASPAGVFEEATLAAFTQARYAPGLITGYPVRSQLLVEVVFEPGEAPRVGMPALEAPTP